MDSELKAALDAVQTAATKRDETRVAAQDAQDAFDAAVATAQAAHTKLTELVASIIPVSRPQRVL